MDSGVNKTDKKNPGLWTRPHLPARQEGEQCRSPLTSDLTVTSYLLFLILFLPPPQGFTIQMTPLFSHYVTHKDPELCPTPSRHSINTDDSELNE
jgi:hypothetical protein